MDAIQMFAAAAREAEAIVSVAEVNDRQGPDYVVVLGGVAVSGRLATRDVAERRAARLARTLAGVLLTFGVRAAEDERRVMESLAARVVAQSELLSRRAERPAPLGVPAALLLGAGRAGEPDAANHAAAVAAMISEGCPNGGDH
jgi:hypothetical protein